MAFGYYSALTIDHTQVGGANLTDYPLALGLEGQNGVDTDLKTVGNGGFVQNANGYDIRPYSDSGLTSALTFELVYYDASTGKMEMHVKIPTVSSSSDTVIYLAFGNSALTTDGSSTSTWNSNYKEVFHFKDGSSLSVNDSTVNANNGTNSGATATTGQIDGGASFDGTDDIIGTFGSSLSAAGQSRTISAWINIADTIRRGIVGTRGAGGGFVFTVNRTTAGNLTYFHTGVGTIELPGGISTNTWYYVTLTYDASGTTAELFVNAVSLGTQSMGNDTNPSFNGLIAGEDSTDPGGGSSWSGKLDEIRITNDVKPAGWITADYNNQVAGSNFFTVAGKVALSAFTKLKILASTKLSILANTKLKIVVV